MGTYCRSADLYLDNGKDISNYLEVSLTDLQKINFKEDVRQRTFEFINDRYLYGRTAVPALHIPSLKNIEKDLVIADILAASFTGASSNVSEWEGKYRERALESLDNLRFVSSVDDVVPDDQNTGNGIVSEIKTNDDFTMTELWTLSALNSTTFRIHGSLHGYLRYLEVGNQYPEKSWTGKLSDYGLNLEHGMKYEQYPISILISAGTTSFVEGDRFTFNTYSASFFRQRVGKIKRG